MKKAHLSGAVVATLVAAGAALFTPATADANGYGPRHGISLHWGHRHRGWGHGYGHGYGYGYGHGGYWARPGWGPSYGGPPAVVFAPPVVYSAPLYAQPPVVYSPPHPQFYIERGDGQPPAVAQQQLPPGFWYYCRDPAGYYPQVQSCGGGWEQVAPQRQ